MFSPRPSDPSDPCDASYLSLSEVNMSRPQSAMWQVDSINEFGAAGAPVAVDGQKGPPGAGVGLAGAGPTGAGACWDESPESARRSGDKTGGGAPWWAPWKGRGKDKPSPALAQDPVEALGPSECYVESLRSVASELSALTPIALRTPGQCLFGARADDCQTPPGAVTTPMELEESVTCGRGSPSAKGNNGGWDLHVQVDEVPDYAPVTEDVETVVVFEVPDTP